MRLKILASALPLLIAALFAGGRAAPGAGPCIALGAGSIQIASLPWQAQSHVAFTGDPAFATVRVQVTDNAADADFAVIDDADSTEADGCEVNAATRFVGISAANETSGPVIYLSPDGPADFKVFVRSKRFSAREAAALIVGANGAPRRLATAAGPLAYH